MPTRRFGLGIRLAYPSTTIPQPKRASISLIDFLSVAQQQGVYFMPVEPQRSLGALGRGLSGLVTQSVADVMTGFAFKQFVPSELEDETFVDAIYSSLITEIMVMQHEPIKQNPHIVDLVGVCWNVDLGSKRVWPVVVTLKANCGNLESFLYENRNLAPELRFLLCANIAEAVELLHSCEIAHGDLKPENMLIQRGEDGSIKLKIIDFGASAIGHQKLQPVISAPWNAPESATEQELPASAIILSDLYSLGLICAQILLSREILADANLLLMPQGQTTNAWAKTLEHIKALKQNDLLASKLMILIDISKLPTVQQQLLRSLIPQVICHDPSHRRLNWKELRKLFAEGNCHFSNATTHETYVSPPSIRSILPESCNHAVLDIVGELGEYDDIDYLFRMNIIEDIQLKIPSMTCEQCSNYMSFQLALAYRIGFGVLSNYDLSDQWLRRSRREQEHMQQAISRLKQNYQPTGRLADQVKNAIGLGTLVTLDRAEQYRIEGRHLEASNMLSNEISSRECELGENHISTANLKSQLTQIYRIQGRLDEANTLQQEVIAARGRHFVRGHPSIITSVAALAVILAEQGRLQDAEQFQRSSLKALEQILGEEHIETLTLQNNLATMLVTQGYTQEAEVLYKKTLKSRKEHLTTGHPLTTRVSISLLMCLRYQGKYEEAEQLMLETEATSTQLARDDLVAHGILQLNIALLHMDQRRFDQAESTAVKVVKSFKRMLAEHDPKTLDARNVLLGIYHVTGKLKKAEKQLHKCLDGTRPLGERHVTFLEFQTLLARNLLKRYLFSESVSQAQEVLAMYQGSVAMNPDTIIQCTDILSRGYAATGQIKKAEETRNQLVISCKKELGDKHPLTMLALSALAQSYIDQELFAQAAPFQEEVYLWSTELRERDRIAIKACSNLATIYLELSRFTESEKLAENMISWSEECYGDNHLLTKMAVKFLLGVYVRVGWLDKAESLYQSKLSSGYNGPNNEKVMTELYDTVADLRLAQGNPTAAQALLQEAIRISKLTSYEDDEDVVRLASRLLGARIKEKLTDEIEAEALGLIRRKEQIYGERHATTLMTISDLAYIYTLNARLGDAGKLVKRLENLADQNTVQNKVNFSYICSVRAEFYFRTRRFHRAREEEEKCLNIRLDVLGDEHKKTLVSMSNLSSTLNTLGRNVEAERYMRHVVNVRVRKFPINEMPTLRAKKDLAGILFYQNKLEESESLYAEVVAVSIEVFGDCSFTREQIEQLSIVRTKMMGL
ncbi:MAG: hypothetical protein M1836_004660 [Candelina mexicana]|nr:MAG: hypothetical protein M1836_004660 [Candelina mexicana]